MRSSLLPLGRRRLLGLICYGKKKVWEEDKKTGRQSVFGVEVRTPCSSGPLKLSKNFTQMYSQHNTSIQSTENDPMPKIDSS